MAAKQVRERRSLLENNAAFRPYGRESSLRFPGETRGETPARIPWIRTLMGDEPIRGLMVSASATDEEFRQAQRLFPEARVIHVDFQW
jgi:hypothetical protein